MDVLISHPNARDPETMETWLRKGLKEVIVTTYPNEVHLHFR